MPSGHRGQLAAACPGPRKMMPLWTFLETVGTSLKQFGEVWNWLKQFGEVWNCLKQFETVWNGLKQFETVWNGLKQFETMWNSLKHSEAVWSQSQCYMVQLRSLTTQGLHFSLLSINLLNLSRRHSRNHTFILFDSIVVANESLIFELLSASKWLVFLGFLVVPCEGAMVMHLRCKERRTWRLREEICSEWWVKAGHMVPNDATCIQMQTMCNFWEWYSLIESNKTI